MTPLVIKVVDVPQEGLCVLCGRATEPRRGPQLGTSDRAGAVCRDCGRRSAPALSALLDLAEVSGRVGRISQHTRPGVPMASLLELARASEVYVTITSATERRPL